MTPEAVTPEALAAHARTVGLRLGFDRVGIGPAEPPAHGAAFEAWLTAGHAGGMSYLERSRERRLDPRRVLPGARSVVACALAYHQGLDPGPPGVARYAWGDDYHAIMLPRLRELAEALVAAAPGSAATAYVDTGPLLERDLAAAAGLGWIGKNTMLLDPALGSSFFIGIVLTTAALAPDPAVPDRCGRCTRCLDACPTGAFVAPYVLDARQCIAYLTIEHRGPIPVERRAGVREWVFGCDVCQDVCPWNARVPPAREQAFRPRALPGAVELLALAEPEYRERLRGSPLKRARREGLARNAAVMLGNRGAPGDVPALAAALTHDDATVRGHAAWALGRIGTEEARAALGRAGAREPDPAVRREIAAALAAASPASARSAAPAGGPSTGGPGPDAGPPRGGRGGDSWP